MTGSPWNISKRRSGLQSGLFGCEFADDRQLEYLFVVGLNHQQDPDAQYAKPKNEPEGNQEEAEVDHTQNEPDDEQHDIDPNQRHTEEDRLERMEADGLVVLVGF